MNKPAARFHVAVQLSESVWHIQEPPSYGFVSVEELKASVYYKNMIAHHQVKLGRRVAIMETHVIEVLEPADDKPLVT